PVRQRQLATAEQLNHLEPSKPEAQRMLAAALGAMGDTLLLGGQRREALDHYLRARQIYDKLAVDSTTTTRLLDLHDVYYRLSPAQLANRQLDQALTSSGKALEIAQKLSAADSQNTLASLLLAANYAAVADINSRLGRRRLAYEAVGKALSI